MQIFWLKILLPLLTAAVLLNPHTPLWLALAAPMLLLWLYPRSQRLFLLGYLLLLLISGSVKWLELSAPTILQSQTCHLISGKVKEVSRSQWGQRITLQQVHLMTDAGKRRLPGLYQLFTKSRQPVFIGDRLRFQGEFRQLRPPLNRGEPDWRWRGQVAGICGEFHRLETMAIAPGKKPWYLRLRDRLHARLAGHLEGEPLELVCAMLLGERQSLGVGLRDDFVQAGVIHLLAVSGLHVGFVAAILLGLARLLPVSRKFAWWLMPLLLVGYALLCGGRPSVVRAVLMATFFFWGQALERGIAPMHSLLACATLSGLHNPLLFFDIGFQLSHVAVLSVLLATRVRGRGGGQLPWLLRVGLVSLACFIGLAPLLLYHFGALSPIGILVNIPVIPLAGVITGQGALLLACADLPLLGPAVAEALRFSLQLLQRIAYLSARAPGAGWALPSPSLCQLLLMITVLMLSFLPGIRRRPQRLILLFMAAGAFAWLQHSQPTLEIAAINVGQGDAILLQSPAGRRLLIDAGSRWGRTDRGHLQVVPYLRRQGVDRLDLIILTHTDMDHMGGIPAVLREIGCDTLFLADRRQHPLFEEIIEICNNQGTVIQMASAGEILISEKGFRLYLLSPATGWQADANERSMVVKCVFGDCEVLLTGDAGKKAEQLMVRDWGEFLKSDLLKVGHHGSAGSSCTGFLQAVRPEHALISAGRNNRYGHPAPAVLERLQQIGAQIHRTDMTGTLELSGDGCRWRLRPAWWQSCTGEIWKLYHAGKADARN